MCSSDLIPGRKVGLTDEEKLSLKDLSLLTLKPVLYVVNGDEGNASPFPSPYKGEGIIPLLYKERLEPALSLLKSEVNTLYINAKLEAELAELSEEEAKQYLKELGMGVSGLDKLVKAGYELLGLITFLTAGPKESRAWTIKKETKAPQAAGVIH